MRQRNCHAASCGSSVVMRTPDKGSFAYKKEDRMNIVESHSLTYRYAPGAVPALDGADICVEPGEFIAVLGHNGCGKTTLIKHINALLPVQEGTLRVAGIDASDKGRVWELRKMTGMVFQNPDNQFVSSVVGDDVAFGLENYQVMREVIDEKVSHTLKEVGMEGFEERAVHSLSGGQKQRVALAGVLALDPDMLIFDEATSMLDPEGRREVLEKIKYLNREKKKTVIMITHYVEESIFADRIILMKNGKVLASGAPREILKDEELLLQTGLLPPAPVQIYLDLMKKGIKLPDCPLTEEELVEMICQ